MNRGVAQLCEIKTWSLWVVSCSSLSGTNGDLRTPSMIEINMFPKMLQTDHHRPRFWWILKHLQPQVSMVLWCRACCLCMLLYTVYTAKRQTKPRQRVWKVVATTCKEPQNGKLLRAWRCQNHPGNHERPRPNGEAQATKLRKQKQLLTACIKRQPCRVPKKWQTNHGYLSLNFKQV